jgi:hypothetical protein
LLYNEYAGDNPYEYLAWTLDPTKASNADTNDPGLFMATGSAGDPPPQSRWVFDWQSDGTYRIYNTDNSYPGVAKRLDVHADGIRPFLGDIGSTNAGQVWELYSSPDDTSLQVYNKGWEKVLDIDGTAGDTPINAPFMNSNAQSTLKGQAWQLADWTPTSLETATSVTTQYQTVTPEASILYVGGSQVSVTTTQWVYSTFVSYLLPSGIEASNAVRLRQ